MTLAAATLPLVIMASVLTAAEVPPVPQPLDSMRMLITWSPVEGRCEGIPLVMGPSVRRPFSSLSWSNQANVRPLAYRFTIDATGRPLSIERDGLDFVGFSEDVEPALAASNFPGGAKASCQITYAPKVMPFGDAPVGDLMSYTITPTGGALPKAGWDRFKPPGDCSTTALLSPLVATFPDYAHLSGVPGVRDWTIVGYDIDPRGKTFNAHVVGSNGNAALEKAAVKAIEGTKFNGGPRTGCLMPYHRNAMKLVAPPVPDEASFQPPGATCTEPHRWTKPLAMQFPQNYRRRMIEGWAIIRYDVASWGAVGNIKVLRSEPSDDFGKQATLMLQGATLAPSATGMTGCIDRVRYVLDPRPAPSD